jgi:hypothetical protein
MLTLASKEHARHIRLVHEYITETEPVKEHNTDELRKCLLGLERKREDGLSVGGKRLLRSRFGLRIRGLNRAEKVHPTRKRVWYLVRGTSTTFGHAWLH